MIIVKLIGGLGNQMFQYALARHLAEKNSAILKLDPFDFEAYRLRQYGLHCFHIWEHIATKQEIEDIQKDSTTKTRRLIAKVGQRLGFGQLSFCQLPKGALLQESSSNFDPDILKRTGDLYVQGYWQCEKYFIDIQNILSREFVVKYKQDCLSEKITEHIMSVNSVSLHIRRGDYAYNPITNKFHGVCGSDYYILAVKYIAERVENPHFFIFSDDTDWVKRNFFINFPNTIISHNSMRNYEDLRLMSQCKHNIIANSTFSWWAAWLNVKPDKIVVAPKRWFIDQSINTNDLFPRAWVRL